MLLGRLVQVHLRHGTVGVYWKCELHTCVFDCATLAGNNKMFAVIKLICVHFFYFLQCLAFRAEITILEVGE